jgi:hypothetical protein
VEWKYPDDQKQELGILEVGIGNGFEFGWKIQFEKREFRCKIISNWRELCKKGKR